MNKLGIDIGNKVGYMSRHHGSPYDRGSADSYYQRGRRPHYYGGKQGGPYGGETKFVEADMTAQEIQEYNQGFNDNEDDGNWKSWI